MLRVRTLLFLLCMVIYKVIPQVNIDSLDNKLKTLKNDNAKIDMLVSSGRSLLYTVPDKAITYIKHAINLSKENKYPLGLANAYRVFGAYYSDIKNEIPSAVKYYQLADSIYHLYNEADFKEGIGAIQHSYGTIQLRQGNYLEAMRFFVKASQVLDSLNNKTILQKTYNNLSNLYLFLKQFDKAEFYSKECIKLAQETNDTHIISGGYITLASILIEQKRYNEALPNIQKANKIAEIRNDHYILELCNLNLGMYYNFYKKDHLQAIYYAQKALIHANKLGNTWEEARILTDLAGFYLENHQAEKARITALQACNLLTSQNSSDLSNRALSFLAQSDALKGNYKDAYNHLLKSYNLADTVFKEENQRQINYLEAQYQSEKKEKEILKLQNEKQISVLVIKRRNTIIYALSVTIVLLIGIAFLINRNFHHKRIIAQKENEIQKRIIQDMEKERMLLATQSVLKGEESERKRLARDLHDGLGGFLSGAKTALNSVKTNVLLNSNTVNDFNMALTMLDFSIKEMQRVAHNMMPEALMKLGLKDTLTDFCNELDKVNPLHIIFQFFGNFERVDPNLEINIYRIIQELVNNAIKHSDASELVVQMIQESKRLCFIVLDNGKGFDLQKLDYTKGVGLASAKSRVSSFHGQIDINSKPGKGTEITIEFLF